MAEMKKVATRDSYGAALTELGAQYDNLVVLDADLAGATKTGTFKKAFPDRFFDCGIAEANMVDMAAGASTMGLIPFCSTFAVFAGRSYDQIRNGVCYPKLNVKLGFSHAGITLG
ncbi:MAG: transketolase family protein, partial [Oscillospiraceae bacterium]|nr:transketolase family protein [Oscillospiraceae bacterium]